MARAFDLVVLGGGPGGYVAAIRAAQLGMKVAIVDRAGRLGGTCLNIGCIPTKALVSATDAYEALRERVGEFGILASDVGMDLSKLQASREKAVRTLTDGLDRLMKRHKIQVYWAEGRLEGPGRVSMEPPGGLPKGWIPPAARKPLSGPEVLEAKNVLLALGSRPVALPMLPFDGERILDSTDAMTLAEVPGRLIVVGGGAVGLELASIWRRLGAQVTLVEMLPRIAPFADKMASTGLKKALEAQGIQVLTSHRVRDAQVGDEEVSVVCEGPEGQTVQLSADKVLVAVGRRPNSEGLSDLGIQTDERGRVVVDGSFETSLKGVFAVGDLVSGPMLAHKASEEGVAAVEAMAGKRPNHRPELVPSVVYTRPELAQVGATEQDLRDSDRPYRAGRFYFQANGRAVAAGEAAGFVKVLADPDSDAILGVSILGPSASELIHTAVVAMASGMTAQDLGRLVCAHPTLAETLKEAALAVHREAIHG